MTAGNLYHRDSAEKYTQLIAAEVSVRDTKQTAGGAINLQASLLYQHSRFAWRSSNEVADGLSSFSVGFALSRDLSASPAYLILPQIGVFYTGLYVGEEAPDDPLVTAGFSLGLGLPLGKEKMLTLEPGAAYNKGGVTAAIALGFIITE